MVFLLLAAAGCQAAWAANRRAILIGINIYNPPNATVSADPAVRGSGRKALLKGDPRHWYFPDLDGAINDVRLMESVLRSAPYNFQDAEVIRLENEQATAEAILKTLKEELVTKAGAGDIRLVYYSGHGNFIKNLGSKETSSTRPSCRRITGKVRWTCATKSWRRFSGIRRSVG
jgi:hypothetical protein